MNRSEESPAKGPPHELDPDPIERLVSLGGVRTELPEERAGRLRSFFQESLERELRGRMRRRRAVQWVMSFASAAVAVFLLVQADAVWKPTGARNQREPVAELIKVTGPVTRSAHRTRSDAQPIDFGEPIRAGDLVRTGATGRAALALANGSSVRLDYDSSLRIDSDNRLILDRGAVYVDSYRPQPTEDGIEVRTPVGTVREIGTQFETRLHEGRLRVRVRTGSVVVQDPSGTYAGEASDELTIAGDGQLARRSIPSYSPDWDWVVEVAPTLELEGTDLSGFLDWYAREAGVSVRYSDAHTAEQLRGVRIHGPVDFETPFEALPIVLAASDVDYEVKDGVLVIAAAD